MNTPEISVVMSVYNGADTLETSLQSVLSQQEVSLEFIVVNDGSCDASLAILKSAALQDSRIKIIDQSNTGLTRALITACSQAHGKYIARQDSGDISLPGRFKAQFDELERNPKVCMVSCATRFVTTNSEELYTVSQSKESALNGLKKNKLEALKGPSHHGSVMFRRDVYRQAGGYREEFLVAQDIDLWTRMIEHGDHVALREVRYQAVVEKNSISMNKRDSQFKAAQFILDCITARAKLGSDSAVLEKLKDYNDTTIANTITSHHSDSDYYYFLGSNLAHRRPIEAKQYLTKAFRANPLNWRALLKLIKLLVKPKKNKNDLP